MSIIQEEASGTSKRRSDTDVEDDAHESGSDQSQDPNFDFYDMLFD